MQKKHTIEEELILQAVIEIVDTMYGDNFAKQLQCISLSNDTVALRIGHMSENIQQQLLSNICEFFFFSI